MKNLTILQINDLHGYLAPHSEISIWGAMNACSPAEASDASPRCFGTFDVTGRRYRARQR